MRPPAITHTRIALLVLAVALAGTVRAQRTPDWPAIERQTRPWTRWWWMGSAVTPEGLTVELEALRAAGLGGVEYVGTIGVKVVASYCADY